MFSVNNIDVTNEDIAKYGESHEDIDNDDEHFSVLLKDYQVHKCCAFRVRLIHFFLSGFVRTRLTKVDVPLDYPKGSQKLEIRHQIQLPSDDTTYWCSVHKLPNIFRKKHHAIQVRNVPISTSVANPIL